jgi:hypothetical protein
VIAEEPILSRRKKIREKASIATSESIARENNAF